MRDFWIFGYGSLMWNPGFEFLQASKARVMGLHRSLCVHSWVHRGTQESPGLVLGLDKGGSCLGIAYRVAEKNRTEVIDYLRARELPTDVYVESLRKVVLEDGQKVEAVLYQVDRSHQQYACDLSMADQIHIVRHAVGRSGANPEYLLNTVDCMRNIGIRDRKLEEISDALV